MSSSAGTSTKKRKFRLFGRKKDKTAVDSANPAKVSSVSTSAAKPQPPRLVRVVSPKRLNGEASIKSEKERASPGKSSWLARTKFFSDMSDNAFKMVDVDGSQSVDEKELYSGLLLIHLKLGLYAGPAACRPVDRKRVHDVFHKMDVDKSGSLDRAEFKEVMTVLCSNVLTRVIAQWSLTLIIVPLVAQKILDGLYYANAKFWAFVMDLDEYSPTMDKVEVFVEDTRDWLLDQMPDVVLEVAGKIKSLLDMVPESVWNTIPLTALSCILGVLVVPFVIFKIDDYFQGLADEKKKTFEGDENGKGKQ